VHDGPRGTLPHCGSCGPYGRGTKLMNTMTTSSQRYADAPSRASVEWLRCPGEHAALAVCIASNVFLVLLAWTIILAGSDWLDAHPFVATHHSWVRALALSGAIAFPALPLTRHLALHAPRSNGVRVGKAQFPELQDQLLLACRKLGVRRVPELYLGRGVEGPSAAYSTWWRSVIVLNADLVPTHWKEGLDWLSFAMAGALGAVRLGHTRWWVALLTGYAGSVTGLSSALLIKRTFSRDRCAAFVFPEGVRGLVVEAVGKDAVANVSISRFVEQSKDCRGTWDFLAALWRKSPPIAVRAAALYDAGFFDMTRDRKRLGAATGDRGETEGRP
jgi:hypothetical protein